jgi:hypothetical protein
MITCYLQGGLGNQLFEIFTTIAYAMKLKTKFIFSKIHQLHHGNNGTPIRYTYWSSFLSSLSPFLIHMDNDAISQYLIIKEKTFSYSDLPNDYHPELSKMLVGYFQSPKYFEHYKDSIFKLINLEKQKNNLKQKCDLDYNNIISIHFRLGDYKKIPDYHPIMSLDYYKQAIQTVLDKRLTNKDKISILYFCEDDDLTEVKHTIEILEYFYPDLKFLRGGNDLEDWEQMLQMSLCRDNIIANSTFSWWGAYFNTNTDKIVTYPSKWFGPKLHHKTQDLFPTNWLQISLD